MLAAINFHYIREDFTTAYPSIFGITPAQFEKQLLSLSATGVFVSANDIENAVNKHIPLPEKSILVTFDDGLKEQFELALPILEKLHIPAIFFINTSNVTEPVIQAVHKIHLLRSVLSPDAIIQKMSAYFNIDFSNRDNDIYLVKAKEHYKYDEDASALLKFILNFVLPLSKVSDFVDYFFSAYYGDIEKEMHEQLYMSVPQIKVLQEKGMLGSHAHQHLPIGQLTADEKKYQVGQSQEIISGITGKKASAFSYPYGSLAAANGLSDYLKKASFVFSFTMERAINHQLNDPFYLARLDNNDVPGGKNYKFPDMNLFENYPAKSWDIQHD